MKRPSGHEVECWLRVMADAAPALLWLSRDGQLDFFNTRWLSLTGRPLVEQLGDGWLAGVHPEDRGRVADVFALGIRGRAPFDVEFRLCAADGQYRHIASCAAPRFAPDGSFAGFIGTCTDITEHRRQEAELRRALAAKDEFLGMVSHELRTPITALQLQIERLRRGTGGGLSEAQHDLVRRMSASTDRLTRLIESALSFSRIERGRLKVCVREFDLVELVRSVVEENRALADSKRLSLEIEASTALPLLASDPDLVRIVVSNLLANAVKFTDAGVVRISVRATARGQELVVRDSGKGIPSADRDRVFQAFEQVGAARHKGTPGLGLGLALVRSMTQILGGQVRLDSELGQGSTFTVTLPGAGDTPQGGAWVDQHREPAPSAERPPF